MVAEVSFIKSRAAKPEGVRFDICRCQSMVRALIEMVRSDNEATNLKAQAATIENMLEMIHEALECIGENIDDEGR